MTLHHDGTKSASNRSNQSSCREGRKTQSVVYHGSPGVARREEPKAPLSINQVGAQEIWAIQDNQRSIPSGVLAESPHDMGNT
jgi:hypothetical protein